MCEGGGRGVARRESADVQADFQLLCHSCRRSTSRNVMTGLHRELVNAAQKLSPKDFLGYAADKADALAEISGTLKRIISNVIGREVASEKSFAVNF